LPDSGAILQLELMSYALSRPTTARRGGLLGIVIGAHIGVILIAMAAKTVAPQIMEMPLIVDLIRLENVLADDLHQDNFLPASPLNLEGTEGNDTLSGFGGDDTLSGGFGDDDLSGV
jgi:hypothetical protein